jgi:hypothetical protein
MIQRYIKDGCQGNLDLRNSPIKILPDNLTHVGGNLILQSSKIEDLNNLKRVDGYLALNHCKNLKSLGKLTYIAKDIFLTETPIKKIPDFIINVNGILSLIGTDIEDLNNLQRVKNSLYLDNTPNLKSLGKLKHVGGDIYLKNSNILNIMSREEIRKQVNIRRFTQL